METLLRRHFLMCIALGALLVLAGAGCTTGVLGPGTSSGSTGTTPATAATTSSAGTTPASAATALELGTFDAVNQIRQDAGQPALTHADDLLAVARAHSERMATEGFFSHTDPDGKLPWDRVTDAGITYTTCAENIAWMTSGYADPAQQAADMWRNSPGHYSNIINPGVTDSAVGIATASDGRIYFTQVFIAR